MATEAQKRRTAVVRAPYRTADQVETIRRYLPANYRVTRVVQDEIFIEGHDNAGWTLDGYVIPRLASGLYFATEI